MDEAKQSEKESGNFTQWELLPCVLKSLPLSTCVFPPRLPDFSGVRQQP